MRNRALERKIELLKEFIAEWVAFRDFLKEALKDKNISAEEEKKFLEIKSIITRKYQGLAQSLEKDFSPDERLVDIVSHAVSLEGMAGTSDMQFRKIENDWHLSYIHLNELLGNLESKRDHMAKVSGIKIAFSHLSGGARGLCRLVVKIIIVFIILIIIGLIGTYFLGGAENREKGLVNYLTTTVRVMIFGQTEEAVEEE